MIARSPLFKVPAENQTVATPLTGEPIAPGMRKGGAVSKKRER